MTLLELIQNLFTDASLRQDFSEDPEGTLAEHGLSEITPEDVHDVLVLSEDNQDGDFSRTYDTGDNAAVSYPAPPPPPAHDYDSPAEEHEAAIQYLTTYVTNNYIDDHDTIVDNSVNQQIDTDGGDFHQDLDIDSTVASGDGAVAAGEDIEGSTIVTGDDNQVGDGNVEGDGNVVGDNNQAVTGDDNTTSFGEGDATSTEIGGNVTVGAGGAFGSGGDATVDNSDYSVNDSYNDSSDNSVNDSYDDYSDHSTNDSGNTETTTTVEDSYNDNSHTQTEDSYNDNSQVHSDEVYEEEVPDMLVDAS